MATAGQEVAHDLLLQGCRLSATHWQPGNVLTCAAWTLLAACLGPPEGPEEGGLAEALQQVDVDRLRLAVHGLRHAGLQAPPAPALWSDTFLWWYLLIAAQVRCSSKTSGEESVMGPDVMDSGRAFSKNSTNPCF